MSTPAPGGSGWYGAAGRAGRLCSGTDRIRPTPNLRFSPTRGGPPRMSFLTGLASDLPPVTGPAVGGRGSRCRWCCVPSRNEQMHSSSSGTSNSTRSRRLPGMRRLRIVLISFLLPIHLPTGKQCWHCWQRGWRRPNPCNQWPSNGDSAEADA